MSLTFSVWVMKLSEILGGVPVGPPIGRLLGGFHHKVARRMTGKQPRLGRDSLWIYPPLEEAIAEAGLQELETYVFRCKNTVT